MKNPKWILASSSPRRIELLRTVGLDPTVIKPEVDETEIPGEAPARMVSRLSREKALAVAGTQPRRGTCIVIAADTTVVAPDGKTILGKPLNAKDARRMLTWLAGKEHTVLTSYTLWIGRTRGEPKLLTRVVRTRVKMRRLSAKRIAAFVQSGEPMDKAGAYAAQGFGMGFIESIRGSYTNVVGLPISQLLQDLEHEGLWK